MQYYNWVYFSHEGALVSVVNSSAEVRRNPRSFYARIQKVGGASNNELEFK